MGETVSETAISLPSLRSADRLVVPEPLTPAQPFQDHRLLVQPIRRQQQRDRLADHLGGGVAEHRFGGADSRR